MMHKDDNNITFREAALYTPEVLDKYRQQIDSMSAEDCMRMQRFAQAGHPIFRNDLPLWDYFQAHFKQLGGITPELSKQVGWE